MHNKERQEMSHSNQGMSDPTNCSSDTSLMDEHQIVQKFRDI